MLIATIFLFVFCFDTSSTSPVRVKRQHNLFPMLFDRMDSWFDDGQSTNYYNNYNSWYQPQGLHYNYYPTGYGQKPFPNTDNRRPIQPHVAPPNWNLNQHRKPANSYIRTSSNSVSSRSSYGRPTEVISNPSANNIQPPIIERELVTSQPQFIPHIKESGVPTERFEDADLVAKVIPIDVINSEHPMGPPGVDADSSSSSSQSSEEMNESSENRSTITSISLSSEEKSTEASNEESSQHIESTAREATEVQTISSIERITSTDTDLTDAINAENAVSTSDTSTISTDISTISEITALPETSTMSTFSITDSASISNTVDSTSSLVTTEITTETPITTSESTKETTTSSSTFKTSTSTTTDTIKSTSDSSSSNTSLPEFVLPTQTKANLPDELPPSISLLVPDLKPEKNVDHDHRETSTLPSLEEGKHISIKLPLNKQNHTLIEAFAENFGSNLDDKNNNSTISQIKEIGNILKSIIAENNKTTNLFGRNASEPSDGTEVSGEPIQTVDITVKEANSTAIASLGLRPPPLPSKSSKKSEKGLAIDKVSNI